MERLTDKRMKGEGFIPLDPKEYKALVRNEKPTGKQIYQRLLEIEDILGDDYDLDRLKVIVNQCMTMREEVSQRFSLTAKIPLERLKELVEADRDGRCMVFPCKVGDIVYTNIAFEMYGYTTSKRTYSAKVVYVGMTDRGIRLVIEFDNGRTMQVTNTDIGYFVFFTKEAAEAVMKGEQDGTNHNQ